MEKGPDALKVGSDPADGPKRRHDMSDLLGQAEALLGFSVDLEQKLSKGGLGGVGGVIDRFVELRGALDGVSAEQLEWAKNMTHELVATLQGVAEQLEQLEAIKRALPDGAGSAIPSNGVGATAAQEPTASMVTPSPSQVSNY